MVGSTAVQAWTQAGSRKSKLYQVLKAKTDGALYWAGPIAWHEISRLPDGAR
jgi:hypothetical protein